IRSSTGTLFSPPSSAVRNHRNAVRLPSESCPQCLGFRNLGPKIAAIRTNERGEEDTRFRIHLHYMEGQGILRIFSDPAEFKDLKIAKKTRSIDNLNSAYSTIAE